MLAGNRITQQQHDLQTSHATIAKSTTSAGRQEVVLATMELFSRVQFIKK